MRNYSNLPTDILLDIITRLPAESILDCKLVCTTWRNLVCHRNPSFSQLYLTRLNNSADSGKLSFLVRVNVDRQHHYFECYNEKPIRSTIKRFNFISSYPSSIWYKALGSFNGIVCLYGWKDYAYCICNPMTREYVMLPKVKSDNEYSHCSGGFGYLHLTNEYKIVELYKSRREPDVIQAKVYTVGSGSGWRNVGVLDIRSANIPARHGVFTNGALHWRDQKVGTVFAFNLTTEKFIGRLSPPNLQPPSRFRDYTIGELGGVLYCGIIDYNRRGCRFAIQLLEDYVGMIDQVEHKLLGWSKEFTLEGEPLAFTKSGGVLCFDYESLCIYDPVASTSKKLVEFNCIHQIFPHRNTLVWLKELGEEDIKMMESTKIE